jgi:eukaryotic-like serine/threonine-protein kinase
MVFPWSRCKLKDTCIHPMQEGTRMAHIPTCPTPEQLQQLAVGELPEAVAAEFAAHLEQCPACLDALRNAAADDPIFRTLSPVESGRDDEEAPQIQRLIEQLSARPLPPPENTVQASGPAAVGQTRTEASWNQTGAAANPLAEIPAALVGHPRYRVLGRIGSGGMGAVFKAEHQLMRRVVALKVIGQLSMVKPSILQRFLQEVKTAAQLTHPNIVTAYDADEADGVHFLVMEYVEGVTLAQLVKSNGPLPMVQACAYVRQAAEGLQYAHEQGMVHRDVKPHNLMLAADGRVKILDFGLARFIREEEEEDGLTAPGLAMGTPDYMAPEQAEDAHTADIRADVYSLGCTLYHLLAGRPPFLAGKALQKIRAHMEETPPSLSLSRPDLPAELGHVVERMLAKDPAHRFQTPAEVGLALAPFASDGPGKQKQPPDVSARAPRGLGAVIAAAAVLLAVLAGVVYINTNQGVLVISADDKDVKITVRGEGEEIAVTDAQTNQKLRLKPGFYEISLAGGRTGWQLDRDRVTITRGGEAVVHVTRQKPASRPLSLVEIRRLDGHRAAVNQVAFSPDATLALTSSNDCTLRLWRLATGKTLRPFEGHGDTVWCAAFTPDGRQVLSGGGGVWKDDRYLPGKDFDLRLWDVETGRQVGRFSGHQNWVVSAAVSPDGRHAASGSTDGTVRLWNLRTGEEEFKCLMPGPGRAVAFAPDGQSVAAACWNGDVYLLDVKTGRRVRQFAGHTQPAMSVAFTPDGRQLLTGSLDRTMRLWDVAAGEEVRAYRHPTGVGSVQVLPNGRQAISGSGLRQDGNRYQSAGADVCVRVWDLESGQEVVRLDMEGAGVRSLAVAPNGRLLLVNNSLGGTTRLFWLAGANEVSPAAKEDRGRLVLDSASVDLPVLILQENKIVAVLSSDAGQVELPAGNYELALGRGGEDWQLSGEKIALVKDQIVSVAIRRRPAPRASERELRLVRSLEPPRSHVVALALSGDGRLALVGCADKTAGLWDVPTGKELPAGVKHDSLLRCVALSADGKKALSAGGDAEPGSDYDVRFWDPATGKEIRRFQGHKAAVVGVAFLPDGRRMLSGGFDGALRLWDVETGEIRRVIQERWLACLAVSADGKRALTGGQDGSVRLWDLETGKRLLLLMGHTTTVKSVAFSPDGRRALSGSLDKTVRLWDLDAGEEIRVLRHPTGVLCAVFTPDGRRCLTGSGFRQVNPNRYVPADTDSRVRLWDLETGEELAHYDGPNAGVAALAVLGDGSTVLVGNGPRLHILKLP